MSTIIGLGNAGCKIAQKLSVYPQYNILCLDSEFHEGKKFKLIPKQESHADYEKKFPSIKALLKKTEGPYTIILGGSGSISGGILRLLEQLNTSDITILYIKPDVDLLADLAFNQERLVFHVLQQYARSAVFKGLYIISNSEVENILGELPIIGYYDKLNDAIADTMHMINVYSNIEPVMSTFSDPLETARLITIGLIDIETGKKKLFYPLQMPREKLYYYSIDKKVLQEESSLFKTITEQIKNKLSKNTKVSYGIYANDYGQNYGYAVAHSTLVQEENIKF